MARKYGRTYSIQLGAIELNSGVDLKPQLRVQFDVMLSAASTDPNKCAVSVTNLNEESRGRGVAKRQPVRIEAGYQGDNAQIFSGEVVNIITRRDFTDWVTAVEAQENLNVYQAVRLDDSFAFPAGASTRDILAKIAGAMGVGFANLDAALDFAKARGREIVNTKATAFTGQAVRALDEILRTLRINWSIIAGQIVLVPFDGFADTAAGGQVIDLSAESGLVGTVEVGEFTPSGQLSTLGVTTLLEPTIQVGGRVRLTSETVSGTFRVDAVQHTGDTHGDDWYTRLTLRAIV